MYQTKQGDTWDLIAKKVYGNEFRMDYLMKNNSRYLDILIFPAGIQLETPDLPEQSVSGLPFWRNENGKA